MTCPPPGPVYVRYNYFFETLASFGITAVTDDAEVSAGSLITVSLAVLLTYGAETAVFILAFPSFCLTVVCDTTVGFEVLLTA